MCTCNPVIPPVWTGDGEGPIQGYGRSVISYGTLCLDGDSFSHFSSLPGSLEPLSSALTHDWDSEGSSYCSLSPGSWVFPAASSLVTLGRLLLEPLVGPAALRLGFSPPPHPARPSQPSFSSFYSSHTELLSLEEEELLNSIIHSRTHFRSEGNQ